MTIFSASKQNVMKMTRSLFVMIFFMVCAVQNIHGQESTILTQTEKKGPYQFERIYGVPGKSQEEIFTAIKSWVIKNIKTQATTNYFSDEKDNISTAPAFVVSYGSTVGFKMNIDIKDGRYRLTANDFIFHNLQGIPKRLGDYSGLTVTPGAKKKILNDVDKAFIAIIQSIEAAAKQGTAGKDDW